MLKPAALVAAFLALCAAVLAEQLPGEERPGDTYYLSRQQHSEFSGDRSSGSGTDNDAIKERVIGRHDGGVEIEIDLIDGTSAEDRARQWQLPARILRLDNGSFRLLNTAELESRVDDWLEYGQLTREMCGKWIFTWNAFKIECNPQAVLATAAAYDLRVNVQPGTQYVAQVGSDPVTLRADPVDSMLLVAETPINPEAVRRERAQADLVAAQVYGKPLKFEDALEAHTGDRIDGTITTRFRIDEAGRVLSRQQVVQLMLVEASGMKMESTVTTTIERQLLLRGEEPV
jgi:hypothetical protein